MAALRVNPSTDTSLPTKVLALASRVARTDRVRVAAYTMTPIDRAEAATSSSASRAPWATRRAAR